MVGRFHAATGGEGGNVRIEIKSAEVVSVQRSSPTTGKPYVQRTQTAILRGDEEVKKFQVRLDEGQPAYEPGIYDLASECLTVDAYGRLSIARIQLVKRAAAAVKVG
jgi:hypothetical protein